MAGFPDCPVSEVEAGVNFRPARGVRGQVAGSLPRSTAAVGSINASEGLFALSGLPDVNGNYFL